MSLMERFKSFLNAGLAFIYPEVCCLCSQDRATPAEGYVCARCRSRVKFIEEPLCRRCGQAFSGAITNEFECSNCHDLELHFDWARSAVVARDPVLDAIHRYKYQRALWLEPFLADLLIQRVRESDEAPAWDVIIPVPLYPAKQREREFNQSERLGRRLARATGIPLDAKLLQRTRPTLSQTRLNRTERQKNVRHAFALRRRADVSGQRILLLDDVFTTGATTSACAHALKAAGAAAVCVWTVARGN